MDTIFQVDMKNRNDGSADYKIIIDATCKNEELYGFFRAFMTFVLENRQYSKLFNTALGDVMRESDMMQLLTEGSNEIC